MPYIKRNTTGQILAVSESPLPGFSEATEQDADDIAAFGVELIGADEAELVKTDLEFVRVLEDVIELLMAKNVIQFTELPEASQTKMLQRKKLRGGLSSKLDLLEQDSLFFSNE
ncbi:MAG: hypothetical protein RL336_725 [Pseudomonadota bacterium]|jgi:hypothetical protein